ncbi:MAG: hypothetical protein IJ751_07835 [Oscillospiraceae bacterium]|nr:hypothetical protein [Oscillospiraceae bacterium]
MDDVVCLHSDAPSGGSNHSTLYFTEKKNLYNPGRLFCAIFRLLGAGAARGVDRCGDCAVSPGRSHLDGARFRGQKSGESPLEFITFLPGAKKDERGMKNAGKNKKEAGKALTRYALFCKMSVCFQFVHIFYRFARAAARAKRGRDRI